MKQKHLKILFAWFGVLIWCALCLYLASQRLADTTRLSAALTHWILDLLQLPGQTWYMRVFDGLRLAAHILMFFVLAVLLSTAFVLTTGNTHRSYVYSLGVCGILAVSSELGKLLVPGRHCSLLDMLLNILGCLLGTGLIFLLRRRSISGKGRRR